METDGQSFYRCKSTSNPPVALCYMDLCYRLLVVAVLHCMQLQGPTIFICRDRKDGAVFGAFAGESWGQPRMTAFGGAKNSFLFRLAPEFQVFWATGDDENYQYLSAGGKGGGSKRRPWAMSTPLALEPEAVKQVQMPQHDDGASGDGQARWIGFGGSVDIDTEVFDLGLGFKADPYLQSGVSHRW